MFVPGCTAIIIHQKIPIHARTLACAGEDFTRALRKALDLDWQAAEARKREASLDDRAGSNLEEGKQDIFKDQGEEIVTRSLKPVATDLAFQVRTTLSQCQAEMKDQAMDIKRVYLSGGGAELSGLSDHLHRELGLPCTIVDPFDAFVGEGGKEVPEKSARAAYSVGVGLALEGLGLAPIHLDLSPMKRKQVRERQRRRLYLGQKDSKNE